jgi:hypothetical protein
MRLFMMAKSHPPKYWFGICIQTSQTKRVLVFSCSSMASSNKVIEDLELYEGKQNNRSWLVWEPCGVL